MRKKELIEFMTKRCKHGHKYIEHPACYVKEQGREIRIGYLDIESASLKADVDIMLSYVIKTRDSDEYKFDFVRKDELFDLSWDKRICKKLINDMLYYDVIITYYGTKFDIPFIRSRCLYWKLPFINFGLVKHKDVYYMVKRLLKLHRSTLEAATKFLGIAGKNHVELETWVRAKYGDEKAMEYVLDHNLKDCAILERLHKKLEAFDKGTIKSI